MDNDLSNLYKKTFAGASWLAIFRLISQIVTWFLTLAIARVLQPADYGLMAMSTIITGYTEIFSQLGLGPAIIQRQRSTQKELSSVFWVGMGVSASLALACLPIAYLTSMVMHEPRVIPITQIVSILFLLSGAQIVPLSLMKRDLDFRSSGIIDLISNVVASISILGMAYAGFGVWSLIAGRILQNIVRLLMVFQRTRWFPSFHFVFREATPFLKFGVSVTIGGTLFYIFEKSDRFFAGRRWNPGLLGIYTFALELAQLPTEKITAIINQVAFPALSKLQDNKKDFLSMYLRITKITMLVVLPLFIAGALIGDQLICVLLNDKWKPAIPIFQLLCISQIFTSLNSLNNFAHGAQNRPQWGMWFNGACAVLMPVSFYFASLHSIKAMVFPWLTTYIGLCIFWIILSNIKFGATLKDFFKSSGVPIIGSLLMGLLVLLIRKLATPMNPNLYLLLFLECLAGLAFYCLIIFIIDKDDSLKLFSFIKTQIDKKRKGTSAKIDIVKV